MERSATGYTIPHVQSVNSAKIKDFKNKTFFAVFAKSVLVKKRSFNC